MKIGIVEDELIIASHLTRVLNEIGYTTTEAAISYNEGIEMLRDEKPDIVLLDIRLKGTKDGIDLAHYINEHLGIPFIFLTANADMATVERAKKVKPSAYLIKPFTKEDIYTSIEISLSNFNPARTEDADKAASQSHTLFVKDGDYFNKIDTDDILFISSDHVYITLVTKAKKYLIRSSLQEYMTKLNPSQFVRVHRGYVVNRSKIEKINVDHIVLNGQVIPVSRTYKEQLFSNLHIS